MSIDESYKAWQVEPTPDRLNDVVEALGPSINFALGSIGAGTDPVLKAKARVLAAKAVPKYRSDAGAALPTFVSSELRQLSRSRRELSSVSGAPDRLQIDSWKLEQAERAFADTHDREPTISELADATYLPIKRISKIRAQSFATPSESSVSANSPGLENVTTDWDGEAIDMVYQESDTVDRKVLELRMGYGGVKPVPFGEIAQRLKLSPASLSRRSAKLSLKISELSKALES